MAYGRLEVYYPDGAFKTFLLTDPNVSIGRSAGNMIALDVEGISRYHVSLAYADGATTITDLESANGTFVDGERLKANTPSPLMGGEEIQIGELRMVFQSFDESPTRPVAVTHDSAADGRHAAKLPSSSAAGSAPTSGGSIFAPTTIVIGSLSSSVQL